MENNAAAQIAVTVAWSAEVTTRDSTAPSVVAPATATNHAARARTGSCRVGLACAAVTAIPVEAPFPHVAAHVIDSKFVRAEFSNRMRLAAAVAVIPCHIGYA